LEYRKEIEWGGLEVEHFTPSTNEWDSEPDRKHWIDAESGLDCLIIRNELGRKGALCGYVGVPKGHPWHGKDHDDIDADVHGGLTFAAACGGKICHDEKIETVANADVWWLGFDCAHAGDFVPGLAQLKQLLDPLAGPRFFKNTTYKNFAYVEAECRSLAAQAKRAS
jgi:hypothetical protein